MSLHSVVAFVTLAFAALQPSSNIAADDTALRKSGRIRAHFDSVLKELPADEISAMSGPQKSRRSTLRSTLRAYRDAGAFPRNSDFPLQPTPYFLDRTTAESSALSHT